MRVGIDARPIQGKFTGDATYWRGLVGALSRLDTPDEFIVYLDDRLPRSPIEEGGPVRFRYLRAPSWRAWSLWAFPNALHADGVGLAHVQYSIPPLITCPVVTTIHDVSFKRCPEFFSLKDRVLLDAGVRRARTRASRILAVSEYTKAEIVALYGVSADRVTVVYSGVDAQFHPMDRAACRETVAAKYGVADRFVLTVGVIQPRKNLRRLVEGLALLKSRGRLTHKLVVVGKYGWLESGLNERIGELGLVDDVVFTGYVPYEDLPILYNAADLFVYPSVYEGFGLPPLESMACGTPVVTGDRTSLPEVVGDAGIMVDPYQPQAFADAIELILSDPSLLADLADRGRTRAERGTASAMAEAMLGVYREHAR